MTATGTMIFFFFFKSVARCPVFRRSDVYDDGNEKGGEGKNRIFRARIVVIIIILFLSNVFVASPNWTRIRLTLFLARILLSSHPPLAVPPSFQNRANRKTNIFFCDFQYFIKHIMFPIYIFWFDSVSRRNIDNFVRFSQTLYKRTKRFLLWSRARARTDVPHSYVH